MSRTLYKEETYTCGKPSRHRYFAMSLSSFVHARTSFDVASKNDFLEFPPIPYLVKQSYKKKSNGHRSSHCEPNGECKTTTPSSTFCKNSMCKTSRNSSFATNVKEHKIYVFRGVHSNVPPWIREKEREPFLFCKYGEKYVSSECCNRNHIQKWIVHVIRKLRKVLQMLGQIVHFLVSFFQRLKSLQNKEKVRLQSEQKEKRKGFLHDSSTFPMTAQASVDKVMWWLSSL